LVGLPVPKAENYNVWVDDMVIGRDEPDPAVPTGEMRTLLATNCWTPGDGPSI
jgi:hypothetical protein